MFDFSGSFHLEWTDKQMALESLIVNTFLKIFCYHLTQIRTMNTFVDFVQIHLSAWFGYSTCPKTHKGATSNFHVLIE